MDCTKSIQEKEKIQLNRTKILFRARIFLMNFKSKEVKSPEKFPHYSEQLQVTEPAKSCFLMEYILFYTRAIL